MLCVSFNNNSKRGNYLDFEASCCLFFNQTPEDKESTAASINWPLWSNICWQCCLFKIKIKPRCNTMFQCLIPLNMIATHRALVGGICCFLLIMTMLYNCRVSPHLAQVSVSPRWSPLIGQYRISSPLIGFCRHYTGSGLVTAETKHVASATNYPRGGTLGKLISSRTC